MIECKTFQTNKITHDLNSESNIRKSRIFHCLIYFKHYHASMEAKSIVSFCVFDLNNKITMKKHKMAHWSAIYVSASLINGGLCKYAIFDMENK